MKTVTIPTSQSPFVVMVNGAKYVYPAGSVQDVPDEVAVVIEAHNKQTAKPNEPVEAPFDCDCGGGGGAQSDWNQTDSAAADFIKNKPFGDMPTGGDTLYWDGNTEGLVSVDLCADAFFYKVSDSIPTIEDFANGVTVTFGYGSTNTYTADSIIPFYDGVLSTDAMEFFVIFENAVGVDNDGIVFPASGVYFQHSGADVFIASLTIPGYTGFPVTKKMEEKYLPGAVILYADAENYLYATSDISDTSKRMTRAELMSVMQSGRVAYCTMTDETGTGYLPVQTYTFMEEYGQAMLVLFMGQSFLGYSVYTAEYVPEG